jgi:hypothetical protein
MLQLGHRFYWPKLARFIQQDPIGDDINSYAYAANNPLVWIDPTGLCWTGLDTLQAALDVGGLIPGFGEPLDLINASISAARGNWGDAALSAGAAIPFVGWAATAGKGAKYAGKAGDLATTLNKAGDLGGAARKSFKNTRPAGRGWKYNRNTRRWRNKDGMEAKRDRRGPDSPHGDHHDTWGGKGKRKGKGRLYPDGSWEPKR